ncbi:flagellar hook-length control protein FliK [Shewanella fodinae]|nr:flagellar hook-length control protein FliK [Shewanella fodinae]
MPVMLGGNSTVNTSVSKNLVTPTMASSDIVEQQSESFVLPTLSLPAQSDADTESEQQTLPQLPVDSESSNLPSSMAGSLLLLPQALINGDDNSGEQTAVSEQTLTALPSMPTAPESTLSPMALASGDNVEDAASDTALHDADAGAEAGPQPDNALLSATAAIWPPQLAPIVSTQPNVATESTTVTLAPPSSTGATEFYAVAGVSETVAVTPIPQSQVQVTSVIGVSTEQTANAAGNNQSASLAETRGWSLTGLMQAASATAPASISSPTTGPADLVAGSNNSSSNGSMPATSVLTTAGSEQINATAIELRASTTAAVGQQLVNLLGEKVQLQYDSKIHNAQIRLDPPRLGSIDIRISVDGDRTIVHINASHAAVKDAVLQTAEQLRTSLAHRLGGEVLVQTGDGNRQQQQAPQPGWQDDILVNHLQITEEANQPLSMADGWLDRKA